MNWLTHIPTEQMEEHDAAGTLGDSDEINENSLITFDRQLKPHGLELVIFENGAGLQWFIQKRP